MPRPLADSILRFFWFGRFWCTRSISYGVMLSIYWIALCSQRFISSGLRSWFSAHPSSTINHYLCIVFLHQNPCVCHFKLYRVPSPPVTKKQVGLSSLSNCTGLCAKIQREIQRQQSIHDCAWYRRTNGYWHLVQNVAAVQALLFFSKRTIFNSLLDPP